MWLVRVSLLVPLGAWLALLSAAPPAPDFTRQPTLYVTGYAHLDTQWRWEYPTTIGEYIRDTMRMNFELFDKYPHYIFNFTGANRYRMMKEYFPADYARVAKYVQAGRWFPAGSSMEENDVNTPSAESIIRQILYGKQYFRKEFGKTSAEYELPDCFGFPSSLPSILAHTGLKGFSTQKLVWGSSAPAGGPNSAEKTPLGTPFNVGVWEGPDGKSVIAALNPGDYGGSVTHDLSKSPVPFAADPSLTPDEQRKVRGIRAQEVDWPERIRRNGEASGLFVDYHYYGTGDIGGSPDEESVRMIEAIVTKSRIAPPSPLSFTGRGPSHAAEPSGPAVEMGDGPVHVISATSEQMFLDVQPAEKAKLPRYKGELELTNHSAGSITSEAYLKRWNRRNELLADGAEKASVAAALLGGRPYPLERLNAAWALVMGGQFHDVTPGTATPKAFEYSWNDEVIAMNQFAGVMTSATQAVASAMNTQAKGQAIVVYNPLAIPREDVVEAAVTFPNGAPKAVRVFGPDGKEVPAQWSGGKVLFLAKVPSVGWAVYGVEPAEASAPSTLKVTESSLENARYRIAVDGNGDVASIFDKLLRRDLLATPARLAISNDTPHDWPAWNMDWADQVRPPRAYPGAPAAVRIVEDGPARVALEVARETDGSRFVETIRLAAGDAGNRVEFSQAIDWKTKAANLKAVFPLTASNALATYNWDIGTIQRGTNNPKKFEVPSHQWFDLTDTSGAFGVTVLSDCKIGSDKPDESTLRLTLLRTPGIGTGNGKDYHDQATQDWGHHEFVYGLAGHKGDWRQGQTDLQAYRLNQPLIAFRSPKHAGALGKEFSLLTVSNSRVRVLALKKAEQSDEVVVRLVEVDGRPAQSVKVKFATPVTAAREINGAEEPVGPAAITDGALATSFTAFQPRTFAVKLAAPAAKPAAVESKPVPLAFDLAAASNDGTRSVGGFDSEGQALPAEMLPAELRYNGVRFQLASGKTGMPNALVARGQTIHLPAGFHRVYVLAAADGDQKGIFRVGDHATEVTVQNWGGFIGQWDDRVWQATHDDPYAEMIGLKPGFIRPSPVAWFASHHHTAGGDNVPYAYAYLFAYPFDVPRDAQTLTLPDNGKIRILAISVANEGEVITAAQPLMDSLEER